MISSKKTSWQGTEGFKPVAVVFKEAAAVLDDECWQIFKEELGKFEMSIIRYEEFVEIWETCKAVYRTKK